jgi:hypothetical protein
MAQRVNLNSVSTGLVDLLAVAGRVHVFPAGQQQAVDALVQSPQAAILPYMRDEQRCATGPAHGPEVALVLADSEWAIVCFRPDLDAGDADDGRLS